MIRRAAATLLLVGGLATDAAGERPVRPQAPVAATAAVMSEDASLVAAQTGWTVRLWDRARGELKASLDNQPSFFRGAVSGGVLAGIAEEKPVAWRGRRLAERVAMRGLPRVTTYGRVFLSGDGKLLGALYPRAGDARDPDSFGLWETKSGAPRGAVSWEAGCRVHGLAFGPGGQVAAFGDEPGKRALLRLYQAGPRGSPRQLLAFESTSETTSYSAALSRDGKRLALGAGERILLWDVGRPGRPLLGSVPTGGARQLFPAALQVPSVKIPGAHQLHFSPDGRKLAALHGFGVVGVAVWELTPGAVEPMSPSRWLRRGSEGGTFRQLAWDTTGALWLVTASYGPTVFVHRARGDQFVLERRLEP